jgi:hypothetical protein
MAEPIVWPGQAERPPVGNTPFGFYDADAEFNDEAPKVADWCARRLGFPILEVELIDLQFYACFEEAITEYGRQVYEFQIREHMLDIQARPKSENLSGRSIQGTPLPFLSYLADDYGTEAGAGGSVDWKQGSIPISEDEQDYDLQALYADANEDGNRLEIRRIFHHRTPAVNRSFWFGDFYGGNSFLGAFGWGMGSGFGIAAYGGYTGAGGYGGYGAYGYPGTSYVLYPLFDTVLRTQAVELGDKIFRSAYGFELVNNKLRIFPRPTSDFTLYFDYTVREERFASGSSIGDDNVVGDPANAPYDNIEYSDINSVGKRWIREYTLACAKETLGNIRSKYQTVPIPNAEVTLDGTTLRQEAAQEKERLMNQLRESLEESGRAKQLEKARRNAEHMQEIYKRVPLLIYTDGSFD